MNAVALRGRYQGLQQIVNFNWRMYVAAVAAVGAVAVAWPFLTLPERIGLAIGIAPALFWLASSLLVSHYVYDRSSLYELDWLARALGRPVRSWINIHSGWDECSGQLEAIFPEAAGQVVDIFDPATMTENSIRRARRLNRCGPSEAMGRYDALPFCNHSFDTAFCIFAAHELRRRRQRVVLFSEIARVLGREGELVVVEHVRDWRNFLAFGPGFLHFFSCAEWRRAASEAGFTLRTEFTFTPFVRVFILGKKP